MAQATSETVPEIRYLTVQDMLWINLQVTKKVNAFDYSKLEESTFYQYSYGASSDVPAQAERFASGFSAKAPFAAGNVATAFVAALAFLYRNGCELDLDDSNGASLFASAAEPLGRDFRRAIKSSQDIYDEVESAAQAALDRYPETIAGLVKIG